PAGTPAAQRLRAAALARALGALAGRRARARLRAGHREPGEFLSGALPHVPAPGARRIAAARPGVLSERGSRRAAAGSWSRSEPLALLRPARSRRRCRRPMLVVLTTMWRGARFRA